MEWTGNPQRPGNVAEIASSDAGTTIEKVGADLPTRVGTKEKL
jgi:hypothetical protein